MKSRYQALVQKRAVQLAIANKADDPNATPEDLTAAKAALEEITSIDAELAQLDKLREAQRTAPGGSEALGFSVHDRSDDDPRRGFRGMADFGLAVFGASRAAREGRIEIDPRLAAIARRPDGVVAGPTDPMRLGGDAGEGYLVPPEQTAEIWRHAFAPEGILAFLNPEPTNSNAVDFNKDESTPWAADGIQAKWLDAGEQFERSKSPTKKGTNKLYRLGAFVEADDDLLSDAARLEQRLTVGAGEAINWKAEEALMFGDGVGKPQGWMNSPALITISKESGQTSTQILYQNATKMIERCLNIERAAFFASRSILTPLVGMTIGAQPVWTPPNEGAKEAPGGRLFGVPIRWSRHNAILGTKGDLQLVDPTGMKTNIRRPGIEAAQSIHLLFDYAMTCFRYLFKIGGTPILSAPITPAKGGSGRSESHFLCLETRS